MESNYLKGLSVRMRQYRFVLVYGAGGVAKDLLILLAPYLDKERTAVVVSCKGTEENQLEGYSVGQLDEWMDVRDQALVILAVMPTLAREMEAAVKKLGFQNYMTAAEVSKCLYDEIWREKIDQDKLVFSNWAGGGFGGNAKYIALDLLGRSCNLDLIWVVKNEDEEFPDGIRRVRYGTYEHYRELGTARIWVDNEHKNFLTKKRDGQCYIQTWHGSGPLKKIEFDEKNLPVSYLELCEKNAGMEDIMVSPSGFNSDQYRRAFHFHGEIMECGYPRNDIFWRDNSFGEEIKHRFSLKPGELMVLYAPTFRDFRRKEGDMLDMERAGKAIEKRFGKACRFFVRLHPSDREAAQSVFALGECIDVTSYGDIQELLAAADVLITDYSSVMWDFSLSGKPVFLFHPDLDRYEKERGYYLTFDKMPYVEAFDNEDLCRKIESFEKEKYQKAVQAFLKEYRTFDRGTAARAVGDRVMGILEE